ncbi:MAG TPA: translocation/assembly module TamB domain-containing protein [Rectinemataceae bacterium]|nr:translocation/assembly module TamB domain-containing protein [Rectinemataceae bacterium]
MARKSAKLAMAAVIAVFVAGILAVGIMPRVQKLADKRVEAAIGSLQDTVFSMAGLRLGYGYAVLSASNRVSIHDIELFQETSDDYSILRRKVISAGDLELRIDLWAAVFGKPADIVKEISVSDLSVDLKLPDDMSVFDNINAYLASQPAGEMPRLTLDIGNASVAVRGGADEKYSASIASLQVSTLSGQMEIVAPTMLIFASVPARGDEEFFLQASMVKASLPSDFSGLSASLGLSGRYGAIALAEQGLSLRKVGEKYELKMSGGKGLDGALRYTPGEKKLDGEIHMKNYRPEADIAGFEAVAADLLGLKFDGDIGFAYDESGLSYGGRLLARGDSGRRVAGLSVKGAKLEATGNGNPSGLRELAIKGNLGAYEFGYKGSLGYKGLRIAGLLSLSAGQETVEGTLLGGDGSYELSVRDSFMRGVGIKNLMAGLKTKGGTYAFALNGELEKNGRSVSLSGAGEYGTGLKFGGKVVYRDISYELEGGYGKGLLTLKGGYGLQGELRIGEGGTYSGSLVAKGLPIAVDGGFLYGDLSLRGAYGKNNSWWLEGDEIRVRHEGRGDYPEVGLWGLKLSGGKVEVATLTLRGKGYGLSGNLAGSYGKNGMEGNVYLVGEEVLGGGTAMYTLNARYGDGRGKLKVGVKGYDLGLIGVNGYRAKVSLEGSGELSLEELFRGDFGKLDGWTLKGVAGLSGDGVTISDQGLELRKSGDSLSLKLGNGKGLEAVARYAFGGESLAGAVSLKDYRPEADVQGLAGVPKELLGLKYDGGATFAYDKAGVTYAGDIFVRGESGQRVGGLSVAGAKVEFAGKGNALGLGNVVVKGNLGDYELGYRGSLGYEGLRLEGSLSLSSEGEAIRGSVKGGQGSYDLAVGEGLLRGVEIKSVAASFADSADSVDLKLSGDIGAGKVRAEGTLLKGATGYEWRMGLQGMEMMGPLRIAEGFGIKPPSIGVNRATLSGNLEVKGAGKKVSWALSGIEGELEAAGGRILVKGSGSGDESRYAIHDLEIEAAGETISLRGNGEYGAQTKFAGNLGYRGVNYGLEGAYAKGTLTLKGGYGLEGSLTIGKDGTYSGNLKAKDLPLALDGVRVYGDLSLRGFYGKDGVWWVEGDEVAARFIGDGEYPAVGMKGLKLGGGKMEVKTLTLRGKGYGLSGNLIGSYGDKGIEGNGEFAGEESLGGGSARYDLALGYEKGRGRLKVGLSDYDLGLVGIKGYRAKAALEGSGDISIDELLAGNYGKLDGWVLRGAVGIEGDALTLNDQDIEIRKTADDLSMKLGNGKGLEGLLRYSLAGKAFDGELLLAAYSPETDIVARDSTAKELLGLRLDGRVHFSSGESGLSYEGQMTALGETGQRVAGLSVDGAKLEAVGSGDGNGLGELSLKGSSGANEFGFKGSLGYAGLNVAGELSFVTGADAVQGTLKGEKGFYELSVGKAVIKGFGISGLVAGVEKRGNVYGLSLNGKLEKDGETVQVSGSGEYGASLKFAAELGYRGISYGLNGAFGDGLLTLNGGYGLEGRVAIGAGGLSEGSLKAVGLPLAVEGGVIYGDLSLRGSYGKDDSWWVEGDDVSIRYEGKEAFPMVDMKGLKVGGGRVGVEALTLKGKGYGLKGSLKGSFGGEGNETMEASGVFVGEESLGGGSALYELNLGYGGGRGRLNLGVDSYDMGLLGLRGYKANVSLAGSGELSVGELLRGEYGKLDTWAMRGVVGLGSDAVSVSDQELELRKTGDLVSLRLGNGKGFEASLRYTLGTEAAQGELFLDGYRPETEFIGLDGLPKELLGLKYGGKVAFAYGKGGLTYEGDVFVDGEAGRKIGGLSVDGASLEVAGKGNEKGFGALTLRGGIGGYNLGYEGSLDYEGLRIAGLLSLSKGEESILCSLKGEKGAYELSAGKGSLGGIALENLSASVEEKEERYDLRLGGTIARGKVEGEGSLLKGKKGYEARMGLQGIEIVGLLRIAEVFGIQAPDIGLKQALVSGDLSLSGDYEKISWVVGGMRGDLDLEGGKVVVQGSGVGDGSKYEIKELNVGIGAETLNIKGTGEYGAGLKFVGNVGYRGMNYGLEAAYQKGLVTMKGGYGLEGEVRIGDQGSYEGSLKAKGLPLSVSGGIVYGDLSLHGAYGSDKIWWIEGDDVGLRYEGESEYPELGMKGVKVSGGKMDIGTLTVTGKGYGLSGNLSASYDDLLKAPAISLKGTLRSTENAVESYDVGATYAAGILDAKIGVGGFPLERYIARDLKGSLEGTVSIVGPIDMASVKLDALDLKTIPPVKFDAKLVGGEYKSIPVKMTASGTLENGLLRILSPKIEYLSHQAENIDASILPVEGRIDLAFDYKTVLGSDRLETGVVAQAQLRGADTSASSTKTSGFSADFSGKLLNAKYRETLVDRWEFSGTYGNGKLSVEGDGGALVANLASDGAFDILMKDKFPVSANIKGTMSNNVVTATMENLEIDLKKLGSVLPLGKIEILDGIISGGLALKGPISDPEINGALTLRKARVLSRELVLGELGPFTTTISFNGKNIEMAPATVPLEQGVVEVSASGLLDQWSLTDLKFNVQSQKNSVVNVSTKIAGITVVDAKAQVDMTLSVENDVLVAEGAVYLERGQVMIDPQGFQPENAPPVDPNALAFRIKAAMTFGKQLEVYLPDNKIPLVRGYTSPGSFLTLQYDSASQDFSLDGTIDLRTGYVLYYLRSFFLKSGSIDFSENSTKFNPLITAAAELRESNAQGTVKIMLNAEKSPLEHLNPTLSSVPFYSETQLIALMSGGVLAADTSETLNIREAAIASSEFIPQFNIFKTFERNVQKALGVDIVFIRSSFMQRWLLDLTKPATEANPEDPLARYLDKSELYVGKYITDSAFLHAGLKFREDPLVSSSRLRLDSEFGIELESPLGLINWSITPSIDEGSLVTGQELSLSWRYVY